MENQERLDLTTGGYLQLFTQALFVVEKFVVIRDLFIVSTDLTQSSLH